MMMIIIIIIIIMIIIVVVVVVKIEKNLWKIFFQICDILYQVIKKIKEKKTRLFEKFDFFINYESLWAAAAMKRKIVQHMYIYKQQPQQT